MKKSLICLIISIFLLLPIISAATINAPSCSQTDVQAAANAAQDGDTVLVPAGTCTWFTLTSNAPALFIDKKNIILNGAGIGKTIIIDETSDAIGTKYGEHLITVEGVAGKPFRITGFTLRRYTIGDTDSSFINIRGSAMNWRVDHNEFITSTSFGSPDTCVGTSGFTYGLIDNNLFRGMGRVVIMGDADASWKRPLTLGTSNAVYIENNQYNNSLNGTYIMSNAVDSNNGGRYVFRHNDCDGGYVEAHGSQWGRGTFSYEVYENVIRDSPVIWVPFSFRGGTGVIFNNTAYNFLWGADRINIYYDRACGPSGLECACDGTCYIDGNQESTGWPCRDQLGRSTDYGVDSVHPQTHEPAYEWNNTNYINGVPSDIDFIPHSGCERNAILLKRDIDYFNNTIRADYIPYIYPHPLSVAPSGTDICGEGEITNECWCEGLKSVGYCYNGYYSTEEGDRIIEPPVEQFVTIQEMLNAYQNYKRNEVSILYFLDKLRNWIVFW